MNKNDKTKKITGRLLVCFGVITGLFIIVFPIYQKKGLQVSFLDVGQGDSTLIQTANGKIILIDGGPDNLVLNRLGERLPFYKRELDLVVVSHFHDDHITGLIEILRRYKVEKIIYASDLESSSLADLLFSVAKKNNTALIAISKQADIRLDNDCELIFLNPLSLKVKKNENNSLITKLNCVSGRFLFSGDNEVGVEKVLLASDLNIQADIFKASHHGSKTSNTYEFLKAVNPFKIIISVGVDNRFKHPSAEVLEIINKLKIKVFRTDISGTIDISSNIK
ncbi:MAG: MBL fold metallo-hydrolase [Patescibacteria group bacterium]